MAEYDGSIRIGTGIDTKEFKAGSKEIEAEARRMAKTVSSSFGDSAKIALQKQTDAFVKMNQQYASQEQKVKDLGEKLHELQRTKVETPVFKETSRELSSTEKKLDNLYGTLRRLEAEGKENTDPYKHAIVQIDIYKKKVSELQNQLKELETSGEAYQPADTSKVQQEIAAAEQKQMQMYTALQTAADSLTQKTSAQAVEEERLAQIRENAVVGNQRIVETVERIKQLEQEIADLKAAGVTEGYEDYDSRIQELERLKQEVRDYANETNEMQDSYKRLGQALTDLNGKLSSILRPIQKIQSAFAQDVTVGGYEKLKSSLGELGGIAIRAAETVKNAFATLKQGPAAVIHSLSSSLMNMANTVNSAIGSVLGNGLEKLGEGIGAVVEKIKIMVTGIGSAISSAAKIVLEKLAGLVGSGLNLILHPFQSLKNVATTTLGGIANIIKGVLGSALEGLKNRAAGLAASIINGIVHPFQTLKKIGGSAVKGVTKLFSGMITVAKKAGKAISSIASILKRAASSMLGFGKSAKSTNGVFGGGLKNILKYGLGIRSLYALINKLRTAIKEGFTNMANEIDGFKAKVESLQGSTLTLKNSFAAAFRPLVEVAIPYIQMVVDAMSQLLDKVGQFMAAITGQKTYTKAIKQTTAAIEDENKAQNKQLSGLDKLNNLSSGSGGSSDSGASSQMFEENVPISSPMLDIYQNLKDMIESEDWEGLGAYIAGALNQGLQKIYDVINWDNVGPYITYFVTAFTGAFNGLVDNLDWDLLGRTIGAGINTIVNSLTLLISGIDWVALGTGLAAGLNGLANEVDFTNVGNLIGLKFMVLPSILLGFVTNLDWAAIGTQIGNALNGVVSAIDLSQIGELLGKGLTGIFQMAISFAATFDWKALGTNIFQGINSFFENTDWAIVGKGFSDIVTGLFDMLLVTIQGIDWKQIGTSIGTFLANIDWGKIIYDALVLLFELPKILWDTLSGVIQSIDWGQLVTDIAVAIKTFFEEYDWAGWFYSAGEYLGSIFAAVFDVAGVIGEYIMQAVDSLKEYFLGYIIESLSGLDEDASLWEIGWAIIQGMFNGIIDTIANIGEWIWENIFSPFIEGFKSAFGIHSPSTVMEEMGNFLMEGLFNGIQSLVDAVTEIWEFMKEIAISLWESVKEKISTIVNGIKSVVTAVINTIKTVWTTVWNAVKTVALNIWNGIKTTISTVINSVKTVISTALNAIKAIWNTVWTGLKTTVVNIFNGIWTAIKSVINSILGGIENMANGVIDGINFVIGALNGLSFDIPDWVPLIGGETFGFNIPELSQVSIPRLATGTVVPPNNEFLAVLGDNKREPEVVSPLSTIEQAVENAMRRNGGIGGGEVTIKIPVEIDGRVLFELMKKFDLEQYRRTGRPSFQM